MARAAFGYRSDPTVPAFPVDRPILFFDGAGGRFRFHVEIDHPLTGLIVRYRGWLEAPKR